MLYLYALSEHPTVVPPTLGIEDTPLALERVDGIDAVVGAVAADRVDPSEGTILAHGRVVDELTAVNEAVLPARFGRGYSDAEALRSAVAEHADGLRQALERVRGCRELGLRVLSSRPGAEAARGGGREYMVARLDERRRAEHLADELHRPLAALARAEVRSVASTPQLLLSASYLVPRETVDAFRSAVRELERLHPDLTLACTGPWPPYSFATAEIGAE